MQNKRYRQDRLRADGVVNQNDDSVYQTDAVLAFYCERAIDAVEAQCNRLSDA
jgi:hypothetical protein